MRRVAGPSIQPLLRAFARLGFDVPSLLGRAGADPRAFGDSPRAMTLPQLWSFWCIAVEESGDDCLGLRVAAALDLADYEILAYLATASTTAREALDRVVRFQHVLGATTGYALGCDAAGAPVIRHEIGAGLFAPRPLADFFLGGLVVLARRVAGEDFRLSRVRFGSAAPRSTAAHERFFAAPVEFDAGENALYPGFDLDLPLAAGDVGLGRILEQYAQELLARSASGAALDHHVHRIVAESLPSGVPRSGDVAQRIGVSDRTLRRRLEESGTTYGEVVRDVRHELAVIYLSSSILSVAEIACLLGFSEPGAFHRAFKRWLGCTPATYRAERDERAASVSAPSRPAAASP